MHAKHQKLWQMKRFSIDSTRCIFASVLTLPSMQKIAGVSIHPRYGGWFALRGVIIFKSILVPELQRLNPPDVVCGDERRIELLERFNFRWKDWSYRDIIETEGTYSEQQKEYFLTPPKQRGPLISQIRAESESSVTLG
jgi:methylmalonic aciduria homocystinuria type C protein